MALEHLEQFVEDYLKLWKLYGNLDRLIADGDVFVREDLEDMVDMTIQEIEKVYTGMVGDMYMTSPDKEELENRLEGIEHTVKQRAVGWRNMSREELRDIEDLTEDMYKDWIVRKMRTGKEAEAFIEDVLTQVQDDVPYEYADELESMLDEWIEEHNIIPSC